MIIKKSWERLAKDKLSPVGQSQMYPYIDTYTGWFLFGLVPLYVVRDRRRRP